MCRASSDCAEKPTVIAAMSPLYAAPEMKGDEQDVGQHVFEGEADGDHEFERSGGDRVVEERLAV